MKLLRLTALGLVVLIAALVLIAFLLPGRQGVHRQRDLPVAAERIWPFIAAPKAWARWAPWNQRDPAMKIFYEGVESGVGARWSWDSSTQGKGSMTFDSADPNRLITYTLTFPDTGSVAHGRIELTPQGTGTRVTWSFETQLGNNPAVRWFGLLIPGMVGKDFDEGLANLERLTQ